MQAVGVNRQVTVVLHVVSAFHTIRGSIGHRLMYVECRKTCRQ